MTTAVATMGGRGGILEAVLERGVFVEVIVRMPTLKAHMDPEDLGLSEWPPSVEGGKIVLVPDRVLRNFNAIARRAYRVPEVGGIGLTLPYLKAAFVPIKALPSVVDRLDEVKAAFEQERVDLYRSLETICQQARDNPRLAGYPEVRDKIVEQIRDLSKKWVFSIEINFLEAQMPRGLNTKIRKEQSLLKEARAEQDAWSELRGEQREKVRKLVDDSRQRLEGELEGLVRESVKTLRERVVEVAQSVQKTLERGEAPRADSLQRLHEVLANFDNLNFAGDSEVAEHVQRLRQSLEGHDKKSISESDAKKEFIAAADALVKRAARTDVDAILEGFSRKLDLE